MMIKRYLFLFALSVIPSPLCCSQKVRDWNNELLVVRNRVFSLDEEKRQDFEGTLAEISSSLRRRNYWQRCLMGIKERFFSQPDEMLDIMDKVDESENELERRFDEINARLDVMVSKDAKLLTAGFGFFIVGMTFGYYGGSSFDLPKVVKFGSSLSVGLLSGFLGYSISHSGLVLRK